MRLITSDRPSDTGSATNTALQRECWVLDLTRTAELSDALQWAWSPTNDIAYVFPLQPDTGHTDWNPTIKGQPYF